MEDVVFHASLDQVLYREALAAAAGTADVGVVEDKLGGELGLLEVHLGAEDGQLGLFVDVDRHAILLNHLVELDPAREVTVTE